MNATAWVAVLGALTTIAGSIIGAVAGRSTREAAATRQEADAAEALSKTVADLGTRVQGLYGDLHSAWMRAAAAEARAGAAEARAAAAEAEVAYLRAEVARLSALVADQGPA
jgi:hypothetical protein